MSDLLYQEEIRTVVRDAYRGLGGGAGRTVAARWYDDRELAEVPALAVDWALGVGNPVCGAGLEAGERVLDLGCGAGIDTVLAARRVGPTGHVTALDTLEEMCERTRRVVAEAGVAERCTVLCGEMEALDLPDDSVDVVISNGVLNLSPRKSRALAEIARVLVPGGRLHLVDLTVDGDLPPQVLASGAAWAGCIAGALSERVLARKLDRVGLVDVAFSGREPFSIDDVAAYPLFSDDVIVLLRRLLPVEQQAAIAVSVVVDARVSRDGLLSRPPAEEVDGVVSVRHLDEVPVAEVDAEGIAVRPLKRVEDHALKVLDIEAGGSTPFHTHPHAHEGIVVEGRGALQLTDRRAPLAPGDVFSVPPEEPHAIRAGADQPVRFVCLDCFLDD